MLPAIDFNDEALFVARKINDERSDWRLPPKAQSIEPMSPQSRPKPALSISHVVS